MMMIGNIRLSTCFLLGLVVVVGCDELATSPVEGLLKIVHDALPVLSDIFTSVFGEVNKLAFRAALAAASNLVRMLFPPLPSPTVPERWWGEHQEHDTSIRPFTVLFSDEMILDLRNRIHRRRNMTHALHDAANTYGSNAALVAHILDHWAGEYDFGARERWLNSFPQYITNIQGLDIHYIHVRPHNPHRKKVLPLLMLHGFPVTAFEFVHVIRHLLVERDDCDFVFEIIVPDLPGYGYSEATYKIGMAPYQMGVIMKNLMLRLGKPQFYIHAGDAGQIVADAMAVLFPEKVLGFHTNFPYSIRPETLTKWVLGQLYPPAVVDPRYDNRMYPLTDRLKFYLEHFGYFHVQGTKPDNVGHGLDDSPVALVSWLVENIIMATDHTGQHSVNGNMFAKFDMNDWFDTFTIYWSTVSMTTAVRLYAEALAWIQDPLTIRIMSTPTPVPFAAINFRYELIYQPDDFLRDKYPNLVQTTTPDFGGHFASYENEQPVVLADSIWTSVDKMKMFHENHRGSDTLESDLLKDDGHFYMGTVPTHQQS